MSAYNFRLHDAVIEALQQAIIDDTEWFITNGTQADFGSMKFNLGRIHGLREALDVIEATRKKHMEN